jgi:hypothetical protein
MTLRREDGGFDVKTVTAIIGVILILVADRVYVAVQEAITATHVMDQERQIMDLRESLRIVRERQAKNEERITSLEVKEEIRQ